MTKFSIKIVKVLVAVFVLIIFGKMLILLVETEGNDLDETCLSPDHYRMKIGDSQFVFPGAVVRDYWGGNSHYFRRRNNQLPSSYRFGQCSDQGPIEATWIRLSIKNLDLEETAKNVGRSLGIFLKTMDHEAFTSVEDVRNFGGGENAYRTSSVLRHRPEETYAEYLRILLDIGRSEGANRFMDEPSFDGSHETCAFRRMPDFGDEQKGYFIISPEIVALPSGNPFTFSCTGFRCASSLINEQGIQVTFWFGTETEDDKFSSCLQKERATNVYRFVQDYLKITRVAATD